MAHQNPKLSPVVARVKIGAKNRIVLPETVREALKVGEGEEVWFLAGSDGTMSLSTRKIEINRMMGMFSHLKRPGELISEELIRDRRAEARREALKDARWARRAKRGSRVA